MVFEETEKLEGYAVLKASFHYLQTEQTTADRKVSCGRGQECAQHTGLQSKLDGLVDNIKAHTCM